MEGIFGEELAKPSQMKHCWVAPPHLHKGGTVFMFSLLGHVITDRARVTHGTFCWPLFVQQFFFFYGGGGGGGFQDHTQCMFSNLQGVNTLEIESTKKSDSPGADEYVSHSFYVGGQSTSLFVYWPS